MARIRTIKPEFPQSESIGKLSRDARLLFIQMWTIADDEGRLRASSRLLASLLYPYDADAGGLMDTWLRELVAEGLIELYEHEGSAYLSIVKWHDHQKIDRPSSSRLPDPRECSRILDEPSTTDLGPRILDLGPRILDLPKKTSSRGKAAPEGGQLVYTPQVQTCSKRLWDEYPREWGDQGKVPSSTQSKVKELTFHAMAEIEKMGSMIPAEDLLPAALEVYLAEMREAGRYIVGLEVWLSRKPLVTEKGSKANYRTYLERGLKAAQRALQSEPVDA